MCDFRCEAGGTRQRHQIRLAGFAAGDPLFAACRNQLDRQMRAFILACDRVVRADQQHQRIDTEGGDFQIVRTGQRGQGIVLEDDRAISETLFQRLHGLRRLHLHEAYANVGCFADMHEHARHERRAYRWGSDQTNMRRSVALVLFHIFDGLGDAIVDELPVTCQNTADRSQFHAMRRALHEFCVKFAFDLADLLADGRL